jgi:hypothetical protein
MIHSVCRLASLVAAMVVILALSAATPARADLEIQLSSDGVTWTEVAFGASGTSASFSSANWNSTGFAVSALSTDSNSAGTSSLAYLEGSNLHITYNGSSATGTLYIGLGDTGFTAPHTPPNISVNSHVSGTVTVSGPDNLMSFQSFVDTTNAQNGQGGGLGAQTPIVTGPNSYLDDKTATLTSLTTTFALTEVFKITLDKASQLGFVSNTTLMQIQTQGVPEPSTMALAGLGALGLISYGLRRRKALGA